MLMKFYSHHLISPKIREIYVKEKKDEITYEIIYDTMIGSYLAVVSYNLKTKIPRIHSLVLIDMSRLSVTIKGCENLTKDMKGCSKCDKGFHLGRDAFCFKDIEHCEAYSGKICLRCDEKTVLLNNQCTTYYSKQSTYKYGPFDFECLP